MYTNIAQALCYLRGGVVVSMRDYESWGCESKSHRGLEWLTSKKAGSESTQF